MNAVRIYGNLLRLMNSTQITINKWQCVCHEAIKKLCEQANIVATGSNVKVKWNACYAIGNFMKNSVIFDLDGNQCWQVLYSICISSFKTLMIDIVFYFSLSLSLSFCLAQELVFGTLSEIIVNCVNFKVRINGAVALAVPVKRTHYGKFYLNVWSALSIALYQANQLTDFNEYNHRDNLLDQVWTLMTN